MLQFLFIWKILFLKIFYSFKQIQWYFSIINTRYCNKPCTLKTWWPKFEVMNSLLLELCFERDYTYNIQDTSFLYLSLIFLRRIPNHFQTQSQFSIQILNILNSSNMRMLSDHPIKWTIKEGLLLHEYSKICLYVNIRVILKQC